MSVHAIILAAGFGTRLRPITEWIPKPIMPIGNRPLVGIIADSLVDAGVSEIMINTHHLPEALEDYAEIEAEHHPITIFNETEILGTGGPLVNAKELLSKADCFVLFNGDILSNLNLKKLIKCHQQGEQKVTMVLLDGPENKLDVAIDEEGRATVVDILDKLGRGKPEHSRFTYSGISVYSPDIFDYLPEEPEFCSIITAILKLMEEEPEAVAGFVPKDFYWNDLGTVEKFLETNRLLAEGEISFPQEPDDDEVCYGVTKLAEQGSAREFYRVSAQMEDCVLMRSNAEDPDFDRFIEFGNFFVGLELQTPEIYGHNPDNYCVLMEDLGDTTLNDFVQTAKTSVKIEHRYQDVIKELIRYQSVATPALREQSGFEVRDFNYDYLRWETAYFKENYLQGIRGMSDEETAPLDDEFHRLADAALAMPYVFLHRDFQSQNIMVEDGIVGFVDFQGGRFGPFAYDVMSLVNDPYVDLDPKMRKRLLDYYGKLANRSGMLGDVKVDMQECMRTAGLQRVMQALGAYGFLSLKKGKMQYQDHIPQAEKYLRELLGDDERFPFLKRSMAR